MKPAMKGKPPEPIQADDLTIEGLAGQLYTHQASASGYFVWWHILRPEVKERYRNQARQRVAEFNRRNTAPWDKEKAETP
jgi:hypothetical protein